MARVLLNSLLEQLGISPGFSCHFVLPGVWHFIISSATWLPLPFLTAFTSQGITSREERALFLLLPPECEGSSGSLELLLRIFDGMTSEGMWELEVALLCFRSVANVFHSRMQGVLYEKDGVGLRKEGYEDGHPSCSIAGAIPCGPSCRPSWDSFWCNIPCWGRP